LEACAEGGGDLPETPTVPPSVTIGPIVKGGEDGTLKGLECRQSFVDEEGGPEVGIDREVGFVAVLFRELVAAAVDDVLEVGVDW
jgi:hypothetical protein